MYDITKKKLNLIQIDANLLYNINEVNSLKAFHFVNTLVPLCLKIIIYHIFIFFFERYSFRENEIQIDFNEIIIKLSMGVKMANNR